MSKAPYTNVGLNVTEAERRQVERDEANTEKVAKKIEATGTIGSSKHVAIGDKGQDVIVTTDQKRDPGREEFRPVIPVRVEANPLGGWDYILTDADMELVKLGKVCAQCLEWQQSEVTLDCQWRGKDRGCGHVRNLDMDMNYKNTGAG